MAAFSSPSSTAGGRRLARRCSRERGRGREGGRMEWNGGSAAACGELVPTAHNPACRCSPKVRQRGREVGERGGSDFFIYLFCLGPTCKCVRGRVRGRVFPFYFFPDWVPHVSGTWRQGQNVQQTPRRRSNPFDRTETKRKGISVRAPNDGGTFLSRL